MKSEGKKPAGDQQQTPKRDQAREKTNVPGQNPKQNDAPHHDVHHDESRENPLTKSKGR